MTKILLVEDDKSLREIYGVRLLAEGYDIVSAGDGEEALAMAIKDRPDLIVSDVMMPKISGFDMLDILRSTTETKNIKVIMMTALSSEDQRQRGVALGADRYLVKSQVGIEDVVRTVHEVLADAPIASLSSSPAPAPAGSAPTPTPAAAPAPASPAPATAPSPMPQAPQAPSPMAPPAPTAPVAPAVPAPEPASTPLPQPTAPFSTPRPGSTTGGTNRVIEPLPATSDDGPNLDSMMKAALAETQQPQAPAPAAPAEPTAPEAPSAAPTSDLSFEETPRPAGPSPEAPASSQPPLTPPAMPQPPQPPTTGV